MPVPSAATLERLLAPYAPAEGLAVRVWATERPHADLGVRGGLEGPKRFAAIGASSDGLVLVRQTGDTLEDLDGSRVGWERVRRLDRESRFGGDTLTVDVDGRPTLHFTVANHLLLPSNKSAAKQLVDLATRRRIVAIEHGWPEHIGPVAIA
jgi:hypothetical protein